ncbi:diacylglycerol kinase family protein [Neobacillus sp. PS3-40]|uniref:diacylglycerol kinase family protein n=1 Tax=Neobacillus sp. PS3-40 TaxID=3070679 RepID=UPI0027E20262|nr:diacylglycerol kinase family protein [Neobacillus sp. PS3-40]WML46401.1 diacylglycerol kinase family protein [Neobacillus sp. PS3-40]
MDLNDNKKNMRVPLWKSFSFAICGIKNAIQNERNIRIHLFISIIVVGCSFYFSITRSEWLFVLFAIGGMLALELINTAIERVVDLVTNEYHPLAKQAKDLAAGAVFLYAIFSVIVGLILFLPKFFRLF